MRQDHLRSQLEEMDRRVGEVQAWLAENDKPDSQPSIDEMTEPKDPINKQLLTMVAEDATLEDVIYYLDRGLMKGVVDLETYLKEVRRLSREQFYKSATIRKIHEQQSQRR